MLALFTHEQMIVVLCPDSAVFFAINSHEIIRKIEGQYIDICFGPSFNLLISKDGKYLIYDQEYKL